MLASATSLSSAGTPLRAPLYQRTGPAPIFKVSTGRVFEQRQEVLVARTRRAALAF